MSADPVRGPIRDQLSVPSMGQELRRVNFGIGRGGRGITLVNLKLFGCCLSVELMSISQVPQRANASKWSILDLTVTYIVVIIYVLAVFTE